MRGKKGLCRNLAFMMAVVMCVSVPLEVYAAEGAAAETAEMREDRAVEEAAAVQEDGAVGDVAAVQEDGTAEEDVSVREDSEAENAVVSMDDSAVEETVPMSLEVYTLEGAVSVPEDGETEEAVPVLVDEELLQGEATGATLTGTLGVNDGVKWEYDANTKMLTVSGEDIFSYSDWDWDWDEGTFHTLIETWSGVEIHEIVFQDCKIKGSGYHLFANLQSLESVELAGLDISEMVSMAGLFFRCSSLTSLDVSRWETDKVTSMFYMFNGCNSLTSLDVSGFDTCNVTNMGGMFSNCSGLTSLDVRGFDTRNVTNMESMFSGCSGLTSLDVSGWDTGNVTRMGWMFNNCSGLTSLDVSRWDTGNVTIMGSMFSGCSSLASLDVSGWDTDKVTDMAAMFKGCSSLTSLGVSGWDTSSVTSMLQMFKNCDNLKSLDVSSWDTGSVIGMYGMFNGCSSLTSLDLSGWDTGSVRNMYSMFYNCSGLTSLDLSGWDTGSVRDMYGMFYNCGNLKSLDVNGFGTGRVTTMEVMFFGCSGLTSLDLSGWDTGSVTNMGGMFFGCSGLTSLELSGWDTGSVISMGKMFSGCSGLTSLDVSGFDTSSATFMIDMFEDCSGLTSLDVSGFDTRNVTNMSNMFEGCSNLTSLDVSGFDTGNVTNMGGMFSDCSGLTSLDVSGFGTGRVTSMSYMFSGCSGLTSLNLSGWDTGSVMFMSDMFSGCSGLTWIRTPRSLKGTVELPKADSADIWYLDKTEKTELPMNLNESVLITKNGKINDTFFLQKVEFDLQFSGTTPFVVEVERGGNVAKPCDPKAEGQVFEGWYKDTANVWNFAEDTVESDITLFAKWRTADTYTITYMDGDRELTTLDPASYLEGSAAVRLPKPTKEGYAFLGWYANDTLSGNVVNYIPANSKGDKTYYAKWKATQTYTITYMDGASELTGLTPTSYAAGSAAIFLPVPTKTGYVFLGWCEDSGLNGEVVTSLPANSTGEKLYYAKWREAETYNITYMDGAERLTGLAPVNYNEGSAAVTLPIPVKSGYVFQGWYVDSVFSGEAMTVIPANSTGAKTYYAKWREAENYDITYMDGADELTGLTPSSYTEGVSATLPTSVKKPGYMFKGWYDNSGLTGDKVTEIPSGSTGSKTYYAKWAVAYKITYYDGDKPLENLTPVEYEVGTEPELAKDAKKDGYFFGGWYADKECKTDAVTKVPAGSKTDLTYYAKWNAGIKVTFDLQGHGTAIDAVTLEKDSKVSKPADPTAEGFTFGGWYKEAACTTAWDFDKDTVSADTTLYAKWTPLVKNYTVTFQTNGAAEIAAQNVEEGKTATEPKAPTKNGYNFGGWYTDAACTAKYDFATVVSADVTLYAKWLDASGLKIYFVDENGTTLSSYTSVYTGSAIIPNVQVMYNGEVLTSEEYSLTYANNTKVGTADDAKGPSVTVKGKGRFTGTYRMGFTIQPTSLTTLEYAASMKVVKGQKAVPVISCNGMALKDSDYTVEPGASTKWETNGTMTVTGKGNFKDSIKINVEVVEQSAQKSIAVTVSKAKLTYNGKAQTPELKVTEKGVKNGTPLTLGKDYILYTSGKAINAGSYSVTVVGIGDYTGSLTKKYTISPLKLQSSEISASYSGTVLHNVNGASLGSLLKVTGKTSTGSITLKDGVDYTISYSGNKKAGTGKYTLNFKGNYKGTKAYKGTFTIAPLSMEKADVNVVAADKTGYTKPGVFKSSPVVTVNGMLLKSSDYTVQYYTDKECTKEMSKGNPVTIEGDNKYAEVYMKLTSKGGNYTGSVIKGSYRVYKKNAAPNDLSKAKVKLSLTADNTSYSGKELTPAIASVEIGKGKNAASVSSDCYEVTYVNNVNPGTAKVMIRGLEEKGYYGCKTVTFKIKSFSLANLVKLLLSGK